MMSDKVKLNLTGFILGILLQIMLILAFTLT